MNTSKPIAAISPARIESTKLTFSRGSRAIIQVNSSHDTSVAISMEKIQNSQSKTTNCGMPSHFSSAAMGAAWPTVVSPTVATMTANVPTMASRSESLLRTKPGDSIWVSHHISVNAWRRCDIQPSPAHTAVARPITPTDVRASIAEFINSCS